MTLGIVITAMACGLAAWAILRLHRHDRTGALGGFEDPPVEHVDRPTADATIAEVGDVTPRRRPARRRDRPRRR